MATAAEINQPVEETQAVNAEKNEECTRAESADQRTEESTADQEETTTETATEIPGEEIFETEEQTEEQPENPTEEIQETSGAGAGAGTGAETGAETETGTESETESEEPETKKTEKKKKNTLLSPNMVTYAFSEEKQMQKLGVLELNGDAVDVDAQTNLINGSFEDPVSYNGTSAYKCYANIEYTSIPGWYTTATDRLIEYAWIYNNTSRHMVPTEEEVLLPTAADGDQFAEMIAGEASTSMYQIMSVGEGSNVSWTAAHRGRNGLETAFIAFGPDQGNVYDKTAAGEDHFTQMVNWMKANMGSGYSGTTGVMAEFTVYSAPFLSGSTFDCPDGTEPFAQEADETHTEKWTVYLLSSDMVKWNTFAGSFTSEFSGSMVMAMTSYQYTEGVKDAATCGNLIDAVSVTVDGAESLVNGSFDALNTYSKYKNFNAANHSSPAGGIGWRSTATSSKKLIEVGSLAKNEDGTLKYSNVYKIPNTIISISTQYVRDGMQFAELNANEDSSLYQLVDTEPGTMYRWGLSHRGRGGEDVMALIIGPSQAVSPKKTGKTSRDQLMQIVDWLKTQNTYPVEIVTNGCSEVYRVWTTKFAAGGAFENADNAFSWTEDETHTEPWSVWIIASDNNQWYDQGIISSQGTKYEFNYVTPEDTDRTIFGFVSYASAPVENAGGKPQNSFGNLIDNVQFYKYNKIIVNTGAGLGGARAVIGAEADKIIYDDATNTNAWLLDDSSATITVTPGTKEITGATFNPLLAKEYVFVSKIEGPQGPFDI